METKTVEEKQKINEEECCPRFDPSPWDDKVHTWENKLFIQDKVATLFYMPLNFGKVMKRLNKLVISAGASMPDWLCLSEHTSKWNMDVYLEVDQVIPDARNIKMDGIFYSKVYEGPFTDTGKWSENYNKIAREKGLNIRKVYMWYTTCPKCAKKYGKNYTVIIGEVKNDFQ